MTSSSGIVPWGHCPATICGPAPIPGPSLSEFCKTWVILVLTFTLRTIQTHSISHMSLGFRVGSPAKEASLSPWASSEYIRPFKTPPTALLFLPSLNIDYSRPSNLPQLILVSPSITEKPHVWKSQCGWDSSSGLGLWWPWAWLEAGEIACQRYTYRSTKEIPSKELKKKVKILKLGPQRVGTARGQGRRTRLQFSVSVSDRLSQPRRTWMHPESRWLSQMVGSPDGHGHIMSRDGCHEFFSANWERQNVCRIASSSFGNDKSQCPQCRHSPLTCGIGSLCSNDGSSTSREYCGTDADLAVTTMRSIWKGRWVMTCDSQGNYFVKHMRILRQLTESRCHIS